MLKEAVHNNIGNWHSPLISRFFQLILSITSIKGIFVLVFMIPFFLGLYIIARNISKGIFTGLLCIIILFIPPVFVFVTVALKDTYLASFIVFASYFYLYHHCFEGYLCRFISLFDSSTDDG